MKLDYQLFIMILLDSYIVILEKWLIINKFLEFFLEISWLNSNYFF